MNSIFLRHAMLVACTALAVPLTALGQTSSTNPEDPDNSWLPFTRSGYWGISFGKTKFDAPCTSINACDSESVGGKIYTGGQFNKWLGAEVGYINFGTMKRNGGDTDAQGINFSLVGTIPMGHVMGLFGKVGTTYGMTDTDGDFGPTGSENDFGLSYGLGIGANVAENIQLLLEWETHNLKFAGYENDVDLYSMGFKFRF